MDANQFKRWDGLIFCEAKLNDLADSLHQSIQRLGLSMTAGKRWHSGNVEIIFVALDDDSELALWFHDPILARV